MTLDPNAVIALVDSIMDEAELADHDAPIYTDRDLAISSVYGVIAMLRILGEVALLERILSDNPELVSH